MSCGTIKKAFEDSLNKETINSTDKFLIYDNGTIFNTTYANIATGLGVTGSLVSVGSGTQVLTGTAPAYKIKTITGGNGISAGADISGGITFNVNIQNAGNTSAGSGILVSGNTTPLALRRLKPGAGISVTQSADSLTISNSLATGGQSTQLVPVGELQDFPAAVGGAITLADNTNYQITTNISTASRFIMGAGTVISGLDPFITTLTYTGTGTMFSFTNGDAGIKEVGLTCENGTLFSAAGVTSGALFTRFVRVNNVKDLGVLGHGNTNFQNVLIALHTGQGFTYGSSVTDGRLSLMSVAVLGSTSAVSTFLDLGTSTFKALLVEGVSFLSTVSGQTFLSGTTGGGNITAGEIGLVSRVTIDGDMAGLGGITLNDPGWDFSENNKIADTNPNAAFSLDATATTTIAASGTPVQVNGAFTTNSSQLYTVTAAGLATYNGRRDKFVTIDVSASFEPASGTNQEIFMQIAINGAVLPETKIVRRTSTGAPGAVSLAWVANISTGDNISVFVGNDSGANNIDINTLLVRIA